MKYPIECIEYIVRSTISAFENIGDLNHTPLAEAKEYNKKHTRFSKHKTQRIRN